MCGYPAGRKWRKNGGGFITLDRSIPSSCDLTMEGTRRCDNDRRSNVFVFAYVAAAAAAPAPNRWHRVCPCNGPPLRWMASPVRRHRRFRPWRWRDNATIRSVPKLASAPSIDRRPTIGRRRRGRRRRGVSSTKISSPAHHPRTIHQSPRRSDDDDVGAVCHGRDNNARGGRGNKKRRMGHSPALPHSCARLALNIGRRRTRGTMLLLLLPSSHPTPWYDMACALPIPPRAAGGSVTANNMSRYIIISAFLK